MAVPFAHELAATLLLTGGRPSEVLGLRVGDVNLSRLLVSIPGTKTENAARAVPLWPQLAAVLRPYLEGKPPEALLFPTPKHPERPLRGLRRMLGGIVESTGVWKHGEIHPYIFRHTFSAAALQLADRGAPVSPYTVGKWLGHRATRSSGGVRPPRHRAAARHHREGGPRVSRGAAHHYVTEAYPPPRVGPGPVAITSGNRTAGAGSVSR